MGHPAITIVCFALFVCAALVNVFANAKRKKPLADITKPFILAGLIGAYLSAATPVRPLVVAAMVLSLAGDVLLERSYWLVPGGICFAAAHLCYIISFVWYVDWNMAAWRWLIIAALCVVYIVAILYLQRRLQKLDCPILPAVAVYLGVVSLMSLSAVAAAASVMTLFGWMLAAGSILFVLSDSILFINLYDDARDGAAGDAWVMATYALAQGLIAAAMLYMGTPIHKIV